MQITKNQAAFLTATSLAALTAGSSLAAATTASTAATIAYAVLATTSSGASIASITAWANSRESTTGREYFEMFKKHATIGIAGAYQFTSQVLFTSLIEGVGRGIGLKIQNKIGGAHTFRINVRG